MISLRRWQRWAVGGALSRGPGLERRSIVSLHPHASYLNPKAPPTSCFR